MPSTMKAPSPKQPSATKGVAMKKKPAAGAKLSAAGQVPWNSGRCIATSVEGVACGQKACYPHAVPYCLDHMRNGDPSLQVVAHPQFGRCCIAARDLPKGYCMGLFGPVTTKNRTSDEAMEWGFEFEVQFGSKTKLLIVDPRSMEGSQLQFSQCPGPSEMATVDHTPRKCSLAVEHCPVASHVLHTLFPVKKMEQLTMAYSTGEAAMDEFFKDRNMERCDVGCRAYPAKLKPGKK